MYSILDILSGTPWWVYGLFIYLLARGIKALSPRTVSWQRLIIMPVIFLVWSIFSLYKKYGLLLHIFGSWISLLIVGVLIGWHMTGKGVIVDKMSKLVHLKGSWYPLIFSMTFFVVKYTVGVILAIAPEMRLYAPIWLTDSSVSGLITGISWSRFLHIMKKFQN